ncbi:uncharacterized protein LOC122304475 [Carya illinoinensis]|uniref:uncharacterized protein LOC122304475 n=1 Tax=Carya illinoinensis TaxID=32201 RepID=UPI001C719326|nr:uncharacterized protein LOC122304475 [Carya illinoinensis]
MEWDEALIHDIFEEGEANQICSIPISKMGVEDRIIWIYTKDGLFTVRSAYHVDMDRKRKREGEPSEVVSNGAEWKSIWEMNVPGVVKQFIWKATNNILPTRKFTSPVQKCAVAEHNFLELWGKLINRFNRDELEEIATTMRRIWLRRNLFIFEQKFYSPRELVLKTNEGLEDFRSAQILLKENRPGGMRGRLCRRWKKPGTNEVIANWDAALDTKNRTMGMRIFIRDANGEVLASVCSKRLNVVHPTLAKCLALWKAIEVCKDLALSKVILEGDAEAVIKKVNNVVEDLSWMRHIIEDVKIVLKGRKDLKVRFILREGNNVVHLLAKHALTLDGDVIWIEEGPNVITSSLIRDKSYCPLSDGEAGQEANGTKLSKEAEALKVENKIRSGHSKA